MKCFRVGVALAVLMVATAGAVAGEPVADRATVAMDRLRADFPAVRAERHDSRITRLYGATFALGASPVDAAERFVANNAEVFGVDASEVLPVSGLRGEARTQPVLYDRETGEYRFTLVYYTQERDGIPVYESELRLLVLNETDSPVVLASSSLRDLGKFSPTKAAGLRFDPATSAKTGMESFSQVETVIWAGSADKSAEPVMAVTFVGELGEPDRGYYEKWRFVADAETGEVLHKENLILFEDITGSVSGMVTEGPKAEQCSPEVATPLSYVSVGVLGGGSSYTDLDGDYVITNGGTSQVTVEASLQGQYFVVYNNAGGEEELSQSVTPPGPANFVFNAANTSEQIRAQANGYANANEVRNWVLSVHPTYPTIYTQTNFPVYVNRSDGYCPGNAWYDGVSLSFCLSDLPNHPNTSFASVSQHEYGHHVVQMGGSGQDEYGEGLADCISMLVNDDPGLGYGFYYDQCNNPLRTADNACQYSAVSCSSCGSESHECGQLLSGCVWDVRSELVVTEPTDYLEIISNLTVNSVLLHTGTSINDSIVVDFLTLDDGLAGGDGNIGNGSPHWTEICAGFNAHGLNCPDLDTGMFVAPLAGYDAEGNAGGPFLPASKVYTVENLGPGSIDYVVSKSASWLTVTNGSGTLANVGDTAQVTLSINASADGLPDGDYSDTVSFTNTTTHEGDTTRGVTLAVGIPTMVYEWPLDSDPGWSANGAWAWGGPTGGGGEYGGPDPISGHTGGNVYGYNLTGDYTGTLAETHLTSTAIDCTGLTKCSVRFWRWLGVENNAYDHAYVRVSNNGSSWTTVWQNGATDIYDGAWVEQEYDISAVADDQATVYLRWTMGATDSAWNFCGWNIDDIQVFARGAEEPPLTIEYPDGVPKLYAPAVVKTFRVRIEDGAEWYVPGSGTLHYRYDGGAFLTSPLVLESGDVFVATLPAAACDSEPQFYVSAQGDGGSTVFDPPDSPGGAHRADVGEFVVVLHDNFETDTGWYAENLGATNGYWQRGVPVDDDGWQYDPATDSDGSGQCYLTENVTGNTDVDGGSVRLTSPALNMVGGGVTISYDYFLRLTRPEDDNDVLLVELGENDGAGPWYQIARHNTDGGLSWRSHTIEQADLDVTGVTLGADMRVRFTANDADSQSIVEAGVDAFRVESVFCQGGPVETCDDGILNQDEVRIDCGGVCPACECVSDAECDDGEYCSGDESCNAWGDCQPGFNLPSGTACADDGNVCTDNECDGSGVCQAVPNTDPCDDDDPCTEDDVCADSVCAGTLLDCDGDTWCDLDDNCPTVANSDQLNADGDDYGDACDGRFDADHDGDVDELDLADFASCLGGPGVSAGAMCLDNHETDADGNVDLLDFARFQEEFTGTVVSPCD